MSINTFYRILYCPLTNLQLANVHYYIIQKILEKKQKEDINCNFKKKISDPLMLIDC